MLTTIAALVALAIAQPTFPTDGIPFQRSVIKAQSRYLIGTTDKPSWNELEALAAQKTAQDDTTNGTTLDTNTWPSLVGESFHDNWNGYDWDTADDSENDDLDDTRILAKAILFVHSPTTSPYSTYAGHVKDFCMALIGTHDNDDWDDPSDPNDNFQTNGERAVRSLYSYCVAFDYVWSEEGADGDHTDSGEITSTQHDQFIDMLEWYFSNGSSLDFDLDGGDHNTVGPDRSLIQWHQRRSNNFGTAAGASLMAVLMTIGDGGLHDGTEGRTDDYIAEARNVYRAWCGNVSVHPRTSRFDFGDAAVHWMHLPEADRIDWTPVIPVNEYFEEDPAFPIPSSHSASGCLPDEMRRWTEQTNSCGWSVAGEFEWDWDPDGTVGNCDDFSGKPPQDNYCFEALQGASLQALLVERLAYSASWTVQNSAIERAIDWLWDKPVFYATGNDVWIIALAGAKYDRSDWDNDVEFGDFDPGRAMCGVEWIFGF